MYRACALWKSKVLNSRCVHEFLFKPPTCCNCLLLFQLCFWYFSQFPPAAHLYVLICPHTSCMWKMSCLNKCSFFFGEIRYMLQWSNSSLFYWCAKKHTSFYFDTGAGHTQSRRRALVSARVFTVLFFLEPPAWLWEVWAGLRNHHIDCSWCHYYLCMYVFLFFSFLMWGTTRLSKLVRFKPGLREKEIFTTLYLVTKVSFVADCQI